MKGKPATAENAQTGGESGRAEEAFVVIPWESPERYGNRSSCNFSLSYGSTLIFLVIIIGIKKDCCYTLCDLVFQEKKAINLEHSWEWGLGKQQQPELQVDFPQG